MKKITQQQMAKVLKVSQPFIHEVLTRKKAISWPLAEKLSILFPGKSLSQWKRADPAEIRQAFSLLNQNNNNT